MSNSQQETDAFISWLINRVYTLPDDWAAMAVTLVFYGVDDGWSYSGFSYDRQGKSASLKALSGAELFADGLPNPLQKWLAVTHSSPDGKIPARAVLVQIINRGGGKIDPRIQVSEDLEEWDIARYPADLEKVIQPQFS